MAKTNFDAYGKTAFFAQGRAPKENPVIPESIGRYRVKSLLGSGGYGLVFLAYDETLQRDVAIKVPHEDLIAEPEDAAPYVAEARTVAGLDHHHIVPVYDVGVTEEFSCYVVSKYIDGESLGERHRRERIPLVTTLNWIIALSDALQYAHEAGVVHRDVKPGNILIDRHNIPYFTDFGLALRDQDRSQTVWYAGTPPYMSPEQVRGEGHRIDGRSDLFSFGIVFYELLTGHYPFGDKWSSHVLQQIENLEPKPPRQINHSIPEELSRICLKCLAKRISDRYSSVAALRDDLRRNVGTHGEVLPGIPVEIASTATTSVMPPLVHNPRSGLPSSGVVPKGIRSFDEHDATFFLQLLPGPRDHDGLPESIRFWKNHLEETDPQRTFPVGVLYGPSGCGKSSFLKAGLLPRLTDDLEVIFVESSAHETERSLSRALSFKCPDANLVDDIRELLLLLRRGMIGQSDKKYVIVFDQFEQWLHANHLEQSHLVDALRHCDGERLAALIVIRDDFWLAVSRFMSEIEVRIVEGHNSALLDLFDKDHSQKVLTIFGQAFDRLPADSTELTSEQRQFIEEAVSQLTDGGKVPCVRLALFADMIRSQPWTPETLRRFGGAAGVGVTFLEEAFSPTTAPPRRRFHAAAARQVLGALLPESSDKLRGPARSRAELQSAAGYQHHTAEFDELLSILDSELRLITPLDSEDSVTVRSDYQLSHDYLIPSMRDWLTQKQKETRRGRAELRLSELSSWWNVKPEQRRLPTAGEYLSILLYTHHRDRTPSQGRMMAAARRHFLRKSGLWSAMIIAVSLVIVGGAQWMDAAAQRARVEQSVSQLWQVAPEHLSDHLKSMEADRAAWIDQVKLVAERGETPSDQRLRALLAAPSAAPAELKFLRHALIQLDRDDLLMLLPALESIGEDVVRQPPDGIPVEEWSGGQQRLAWAALLARFDAESPQWDNLLPLVVSDLLQLSPVDMVAWLPAFVAINDGFGEVLPNHFSSEDAQHRYLSAVLLRSLLSEDPRCISSQELTSLILSADTQQFRALVLNLDRDILRSQEPYLSKVLANPLVSPASSEYSSQVRQRINAAALLFHVGDKAAIFEQLTQETPEPRTILIHRMADYGVPWQDLITQAESAQRTDIRQAAVLSLANYREKLSESERKQIAHRLAARLNDEDDVSVLLALQWLAEQPTGLGAAIRSENSTVLSTEPTGQNGRVTKAGQLMVRIPAPGRIQVGSPDWDEWRDPSEKLREVSIHRDFEISATEVTVAQFQEYDPAYSYAESVTYSTDCPMTRISYYEAIRYCRWLSEKEGVDPAQMCYPPLDEIGPGMVLPEDFLKRSGYRLPTDVEWEYAARAGSSLRWSFGHSVEYLDQFAWYALNSQEKVWPVGQLKPNALGLFDMHGNVLEWCHADDNGRSALELPVRGGAYRSTPRFVRSGMPATYEPSQKLSTNGFRLVRTLPGEARRD